MALCMRSRAFSQADSQPRTRDLREPTVTPRRSAILFRLTPCATKLLIFSMLAGENLIARLPAEHVACCHLHRALPAIPRRPASVRFQFTGSSTRLPVVARRWKSGRPSSGRPVFYYSPVSVDGNNQSCEERSNSRCSSQVRGLLSGVRQIILGCPKSWGRFG